MDKVGKLITKSMTILDSTNENRFFEGYLTVEMKDKQGEITMVDELYKVLPIWMDRGAPITDTHSNRVIGKGINFAKSSVESEGVTYPAIKITGKIHKNYELDTDIWDKIRTGEYRGLSFGGATKADRTPKVLKDGDIAYALTDLEHYEVAVCKDPAVPLAIITDYNPLAKATIPSEPRGDGKEVIKCDKFGCYVDKEITDKDVEWFKSQNQGESVKYPNSKRSDNKKIIHHRVGGSETPWKRSPNANRPYRANYSEDEVEKGGEDFSNADIVPATVTNTVSQSTQTAKPVKIDTKVGEIKDGIKTEVTPLEGGLKKEGSSTAMSGTGGGVRAHPQDAYNQDDGEKQTNQNTTTITHINQSIKHNEDVNKVLGALAAGAARVGGAIEGAIEGATGETKEFVKDEVEENVQPLEPKEASAARIEKKESWDKKEARSERNQSISNSISTHAGEEAEALVEGTKQTQDEERAVRSGKVAPSRTFTARGDPKNPETVEPKHEVSLELLDELKSGYETTDTDIKLGGQAVPKEKEKAKKECSECGQSFDDEDELYEKQVSRHKEGHKDSPNRASHNVSDADVTFVDNNEGNTVTWDTRRKAKVPQKKQHKTDKEKIDWKGYTNPERKNTVGLKWTEGIDKASEILLENKGVKDKLRKLVTPPDIYPSEIKHVGESTSDDDGIAWSKIKAWEVFLEKKHEWDHLVKDPEEDKKIKDEIDDSGNN